MLLLTQPEQPVQHLEYIGEYTVTAYCSCEKCCGKWALNRPLNEQGQPIVYGAAGVELTSGYSVASPLDFGTVLYIDGKAYEVQDRTADFVVERYNGRIIDIYFSDHRQAVEWRKQKKEVYING